MAIVDVERVRGSFGLADEADAVDTPWHHHRKHQLLYAARGSMRLWTRAHLWLLPPGRAAWIPSRTEHRVRAGTLSLRTVYLPARYAPCGTTCVFSVTPLAAEMILHAMRWGPTHRPTALSRSYFETLAHLCIEWTRDPLPLRLPVAQTPQLQRAMDWTVSNVDARPTAAAAAKAAGLSTRTLARRFADETQTTWRRFLHDARMIDAAHRLAQPDARVGEVAFDLGFASVSAFSRAFKAFSGQTPASIQRVKG